MQLPIDMKVRSIVSFHIPHFCLSLMATRDHALCGRPVAVAEQTPRGRVLEISMEAQSEGIQAGMPTARARNSCRSLVVVPPDYLLYQKGQDAVLSRLCQFTPLVEPAGWGNYFLDLTGTRLLWGVGADAAVRIRDDVTAATRFLPQIGLAANKLVSSVAGNLSRPRDVCSVIPGEERGFLSPLHLEYLPRLGTVTKAMLSEELGIYTIGCLAAVPSRLLARVFGTEGEILARIARGEDRKPVVPPQQAPSLRFSQSFSEGENQRNRLRSALFGLCEQVGRKLRKKNRVPRRLTLEVTYVDGIRGSGSVAVGDRGDDLDTHLFDKTSTLLDRIVKRRVRVKDLTLSAVNLTLPLPQLALFPWDTSQTKAQALMAAIDQVREKFGQKALVLGRSF
jgi:DNA polymerase-4